MDVPTKLTLLDCRADCEVVARIGTLYPIATDDFYVNRGFIQTHERTDDGDILYELPAADAIRLLQQRGVL